MEINTNLRRSLNKFLETLISQTLENGNISTDEIAEILAPKLGVAQSTSKNQVNNLIRYCHLILPFYCNQSGRLNNRNGLEKMAIVLDTLGIASEEVVNRIQEVYPNYEQINPLKLKLYHSR